MHCPYLRYLKVITLKQEKEPHFPETTVYFKLILGFDMKIKAGHI